MPRTFLDNAKILEVESKWFERGVKEVIHIRASEPSLNHDGGQFQLSPTWTNIIRRRIGKRRRTGTTARGARSETTS